MGMYADSVLSPKRKRLKPGDKVTLSLALAQVNLIVEHTLLGEGLLATIYAARVQDNTVRVRCTLGELEKLAGCVAAQAKDTTDRKLQRKLGAISKAIAQVEQAYYYALPASRTSSHLKLVRIEKS